MLVQVEDNDGSQLKDFEVESQSKAVIREIRSGTSALSDEINVVDGVVQEQQYAEYFAHQKLGEMSKTFKLEEAWLTLSVQLFKYAKRKMDEGFDTDEERVSDRVR
ncbi:Uncharacterized protein Fot_06135 [Forsythia ovata]|uniref:Uncharacterized protein n=1 Tax=Forsythia ovata TaxID=205694 RepID=A0ABD1WSG2_9LAMI